MKYIRTDDTTGEKAVLDFSDAVDQLLRDSFIYAEDTKQDDDDLGTVDEWLVDMSSVFEAQNMLRALDNTSADVPAGYFTYTAEVQE